MIVKNFKLKSAIFCLSLFFASSCADSSNSVQISSNISDTKVAVIQITPPEFLGQKAKVQGENTPLKLAENFEKSIKQQEQPNIWLEFERENGEIMRVELDTEFNEMLNSAGEALFRYQYVIHYSENPNERYNASYDQLITSVETSNKMSRLEINSPDGKRKLTENEILEVLRKQSGLINDRYFELDEHFNTKSSFYKFRKSVNEKIGYSIF